MQHAFPSVTLVMFLTPVVLCAQYVNQDSPITSATQDPAISRSDSGWVRVWMRVTDRARSSQPHFVAPLVTTHVMLVQQFRNDLSWQRDPTGGGITSNYGSSRGLEIIPLSRVEVGIFPPSYVVHQTNVANGFGDLSYQVKFRAFSRTEGKGDYFVGFFLGGTVPTGGIPNGLGHPVLSPTVAAAKGLGPWDIQTTFGATLPTSGISILGRALLFNTEVDYRIKGKIWPMLEQNSTLWTAGPLSGKQQVFLTPGIVIGPFSVHERLRVGFGFGVQTAVSAFHQYNHRWIFSIRFPF